MTAQMDKISPCLWFDGQAEDAAKFYVSVFKGGTIDKVLRWSGGGEHVGGETGKVLAVDFTILGRSFKGLNGGPQYTFSEAVSFTIDCADQAEVDYYWDKLTADGGKPVQCGWLTDKFGLSWQVVPRALYEAINNPDSAVATRVMQAMMKMVKIDVAAIKAAVAG